MNIQLSHINYLVFICAVFCTTLSFGQENNTSYYFEGDDVVFVFDIRHYQETKADEEGLVVDFGDLDIYTVAISGQFNNWSGKGWKMKRLNNFIFQLRKPLTALKDKFQWDFKYLVNGEHVISQARSYGRQKTFDDKFMKEVFSVNSAQIEVHDHGNTRFYLPGKRRAHKVILTGTFNNWNEEDIVMNKISGGWELRANLLPGRYEYKFIVDGEWMHDPTNPHKVVNEWNTFNSVLATTGTIEFYLEGHTDADQVILAGSFNDWDEGAYKMEKTDRGWQYSLNLTGGKHQYKFIVDGHWITDPTNSFIESDGRGNLNSILIVR